ncbi:hypothetical protein [Bacillus sp. UNCCL81]|uniref:hypothetical protein n=1 Tax=Bacillus sp. UNCCL81 TaxID=1502755 RepID=UPI0008E5EFD1|nr:hypothetical protein [Bacillus sp. UNCCL81]SFC52673.1 hypothetical protein SAMN02799633_01097 [Bacillus sp. UNCCL81]
MNKENIEFLGSFIGNDWIEEQIANVERKSFLKERGNHYDLYHPFVHYKYELDYLIRRAEIEKNDDIVLGEYYHILNNAGSLLRFNYNKLANLKEIQMRLRDSKQFHDIIWELEVGTMLELNDAKVEFKKPKQGNSNDLKFKIDDRLIEVEIKNKTIENEIFKRNQIFTQLLIDKLSKLKVLEGKAILIEFEVSRYEDISLICKEVESKFNVFDYISVDGKYKIRSKDRYLKIPIQKILENNTVNSVLESREVSKKDLFNDDIGGKLKTRYIIKFPEQNYELKNIKSVLKKANKQLPNGGVVFLKVPHSTFETSISDIERALKGNFSNISAVKLFGTSLSTLNNQGVREDRKERLIISDKSMFKLSKNEFDFLSKDMYFSKYKNSVK